jgi:hypothetical protein
MEMYWGSGGIVPLILNFGTRWRVSGQLHPPAALLQGRDPGIHWMGGWVGPRAGLDAVVKKKFPSPWWDLKL